MRDPGGRSLRKAGRTAVVMSATFLIGVHVVGNSQFAVVGTFTAAAVLGIADFSGSRSQRLTATASTLAVGALLLALGTAVSTNTVAASTTMFVVTLVVGFSAVFSGYFAAASSAVVVFYVVATGVEGSTAVIAPREAGLAFGGTLSLLAAGWLWPSRATADSREALAEVYRILAEEIAGIAGPADRAGVAREPPGGQVHPEPDPAASILEAERAIARSAWRPDGLAAPHKARMYMLQGARQITGLLDALRRLPVGSGSSLDAAGANLLSEVARQLGRCAEGVAGYGRVLPDPARIEVVRTEFSAMSRARAADLVGAADRPGHPGQPGELRSFAAWCFVVQQLAWATVLASVHCRAMHGAPLDAPQRSEHSELVGALTDGPSPAKWMRRARRNLTVRSVHLQNSLRLAAGLALARLVVGLLGLQHGFWVGFATLVVLKTSAAGTRSTALQAAIGTGIGFAASSVLISTFGVDAVIYSVLLPLVIFAAFYLPTTVSFVAGQAFFTMVIVVLFNLLKPVGWTVGLIRLEDVLVGAAIGLAIGMAIWPRGASSELARAVGRLFWCGSEYAEATVDLVIGGPEAGNLGPGGPGPGGNEQRGGQPRSQAVRIASVETEDVFSQYLAEPHQTDAPLMAWASLIACAHRLWFGSGLVGLVPAPTDTSGMPDLCAALRERAAVLAAGYRDVADSLTGSGRLEGTGGGAGPGRGASTLLSAERAPIDVSRPDAAFTLLELEEWLAVLGVELEHTNPALVELGFEPPAAAERAAGQVAGGVA